MPQIDTDTLAQLAASLAAAGLGLLELRGPGVLLRLGDDAGDGAAASSEAVISAQAAARPLPASGESVRAGSAGVFLHTHPMHAAPLAPVGAQVPAGAPLGLLQIGALLLPVRAPQAAVVAAVRAEHGATVGYGTPLFDFRVD